MKEEGTNTILRQYKMQNVHVYENMPVLRYNEIHDELWKNVK